MVLLWVLDFQSQVLSQYIMMLNSICGLHCVSRDLLNELKWQTWKCFVMFNIFSFCLAPCFIFRLWWMNVNAELNMWHLKFFLFCKECWYEFGTWQMNDFTVLVTWEKFLWLTRFEKFYYPVLSFLNATLLSILVHKFSKNKIFKNLMTIILSDVIM